MRALVVDEPGRFGWQDIPPPEMNPYHALVEVEVCGFCSSTDWKVIRGQMPWAGRFPLVLGHESVGRVVEVGGRVRKFKVGDRVTRPIVPATPELNSAFGGFAQLGIVTDAEAMADDGDASLLQDYNALRQNVVPPDIDPWQAALAISLAETASGLLDLPRLAGLTVLVAGTGIAGLAFTRWAKLDGARVLTLGRRESRLALARQIGADHAINTNHGGWIDDVIDRAGGPVDGVIEAIGDVRFARGLLKPLKPSGFASAYGAPPDGQAYEDRWSTMRVREHLRYGWICDLLRRGWFDPSSFINRIEADHSAGSAFDAVDRGEILKAFVRMDSE